jgi:hypothetical protein
MIILILKVKKISSFQSWALLSFKKMHGKVTVIPFEEQNLTSSMGLLHLFLVV